MPGDVVHGVDRSASAVHDVATSARTSSCALGHEVWRRVAAFVPGADRWDEALVAAGPLSAEENFRALAAVIDPEVDHGSITAPVLALSQARKFARTATPLASLLSAYQVGHEVWHDFFVEVLEGQAQTREELTRSAHRVNAGTFAFLHAVTAQVAEAYEEERRRVQATGENVRLEAVRALLAGEPVDVDLFAVRSGLDLRGWHTAMIAWAPDPDPERDPEPVLEALLQSAAGLVGVARPLVVASGGASAFAWLTRAVADGPPMHERLPDLELETNGMRIVCGCEARGAAGFRRSHREALAARGSVGRGNDAPGVIAYYDVDFASLLLVDRDRCHDWVRRELGGLAAADPSAERLRGTLEALLAAESNATRTAEALNIHKNTVVYRVRQAEAARGAPLGHRRLELEAALRLARAFPELIEG